MIPQFPKFKPLELSDRVEVEKITSNFLPYSDFNFLSMYAWDIGNTMELSILNKNLVILFSDYITGKPFLSFIGNQKIHDTIQRLIECSKQRGYGGELQLIPEEVVTKINESKYKIISQREHFDYLLTLSNLIDIKGNDNIKRNRRKIIKKFHKQPSLITRPLNLGNNLTKKQVIKFIHHFGDNQSRPHHLSVAAERFLQLDSKSEITAFGVFQDQNLIGCSINQILSDGHVLGHFQFGLTKSFSGVYTVLMYEMALNYLEQNYHAINIEQDLGMPGLRKWKSSFARPRFLKKYKVKRL